MHGGPRRPSAAKPIEPKAYRTDRTENYENFNYSGIKGELVLAVSIEKETDKIKDFNFKEIKEVINEVGIKKAYQQLKSKYKISRNDFYKLSIDLKDD